MLWTNFAVASIRLMAGGAMCDSTGRHWSGDGCKDDAHGFFKLPVD